MACGKCGSNSCGPIIVRPDIEVQTSDQELKILCDDQGQFLRRYTMNEAGDVTVTDTELDGVTPYSVTGEVQTCASDVNPESPGAECGDTELAQLCDLIETSPGESPGIPVEERIPFFRRFTFDCTGTITDIVDLDLDGDPYTVTGTVVDCTSDVPCNTTTQSLQLCDLDPDAEPDVEGNICPVSFIRHVSHDCQGNFIAQWDTETDGMTPYVVVGDVSDCSTSGSALTAVEWEITSINDDPSGVVGEDFIMTVAPVDGSLPQGTVRVHSSISDLSEPCPGYMSFPRGTTVTMTLDVNAQAMDFFRLNLNDFDVTEDIVANPVPTRAGGNAYLDGGTVRSNSENQSGWIDWENPPSDITWTFNDPVRSGACIRLDFGGGSRAGGCCGNCGDNPTDDSNSNNPYHIEKICRCDDTTGNGIPDVSYVEFWKISENTSPVLIGRHPSGDLEVIYNPVNPVDCSADGDTMVAVQAHRMHLGSTEVWDADNYPLLQSVTVSNVGTSNSVIHTVDGPSFVYPGETISWGVTKDYDTVLRGPLRVTSAQSVVVSWTEGVTA